MIDLKPSKLRPIFFHESFNVFVLGLYQRSEMVFSVMQDINRRFFHPIRCFGLKKAVEVSHLVEGRKNDYWDIVSVG